MQHKLKTPFSARHQLEHIGARLANIRLSRNMTQKDLADQALTTRHTIMRLEKGESTSLETFLRVLDALKISDSLDAALPDPGVRPVERVRLQGHERQRARPKKGTPEKASDWAWNEEIEG